MSAEWLQKKVENKKDNTHKTKLRPIIDNKAKDPQNKDKRSGPIRTLLT